MRVVRIGDESFRLFKYMMTDAAIERLAPGPDRKEDTFALGAVDSDGYPLGTIVIKCAPPTAEVISLYVLEPYRRTGIGTKLVLEAITDSMTLDEITELIIPYSERPGEDEFTSFFNSAGLDVIDVGASYRITAKDALSSSKLKYKPRQQSVTEPWQNLKSGEQKMLFNEGAGLRDYCAQGKLREDLTFVAMAEDHKSYRGCIAVAEDEGELILVWLRAEKAPFIMMELLHRCLQCIADNGEQDRVIRIPTISSVSDAMVQDLFGKILKVEYISKRVVFDFEGE
jgi:GNAT superfamily N-acetyltransferase